MKTIAWTIALTLFLSPGLTATLAAAEPAPLELGEEIVFLKPRQRIELLGNVSLSFDLVPRHASRDVTQVICAYEPLIRAVRDYVAYTADRTGHATPIFVALAEDLPGTAFCVAQPAVVRVRDANGRPGLRALLDPVITLAKQNLDDIRTHPATGPSVLCHEIGHAFMARAYGLLRFPMESPEHAVQWLTREGHWYTKETDPVFAYTEGFAEYSECHYTGATPTVRLLHREGKEADGQRLSTADIRRHEGAQAFLLVRLERALARPTFYRELLSAMQRHNPRTTNGLLRAWVADHPELQPEVDRILTEVSAGAFAVDYDYDGADLWQDSRSSWQRLRQALRRRLEDATKQR